MDDNLKNNINDDDINEVNSNEDGLGSNDQIEKPPADNKLSDNQVPPIDVPDSNESGSSSTCESQTEKSDVIKEEKIEPQSDVHSDFAKTNSYDPDELQKNFNRFKDLVEGKSDDNKTYKWDYENYSKMDELSKLKVKKNRGAVVLISILLGLGALVLISVGATEFYHMISSTSSEISDSNEDVPAASKLQVDDKSGSTNKSATPSSPISATQVAEKVLPSVVSVIPYSRSDSPFQTQPVEIGSASGIIMSKDGYIITNAHVLLKSASDVVDAVKIILFDDTEYEATIVGVDYNTDLAVLKISADNLIAAEFGDSNALKVGSPVYAFGSPGGVEYAGSMTSGIISALNRSADTLASFLGSDISYIQTDTAINPGNSGGPLANASGQVIAINSYKLTGVAVEGMALSIPIGKAKPIIDDLIAYGRVKGRVQLGILVQREIDEVLARLNDVQTGLQIKSASNPELVEKGVQPYDILHSIDDVDITSMTELKAELKKHKPGDTVSLVLYRYDAFGNSEQKLQVSVKLLEDPGIIKR